jgi:competence protein ComEC
MITNPSLAFLIGILAVQQLADLPSPLQLLGLLAIAFFLAYKRCWPILFLVAGIIWACLFAMWRLSERLPDNNENVDVIVEGYIINLPQQQQNRLSFDFAVRQPSRQFPKKIHLNWYHPTQKIGAGQSWRLTVKLKQAYGRMNPGGFDYEAWLFANGVAASGYVRTKPAPQLLDASQGLAQTFAGWRQSIADGLDAALPDGEQLGIIKALTIGSQSNISPKQWDVFRITGTTHLIVISGSHISLIAGMVFILVRKTWARLAILSISPQSAAAMVAWLSALFYAGLAGYSIPTLRAVVMLTVVLAALVRQRNTSAFQILLLALLAVLLFDPLAVLSVGFWLSFAAVALLIYISSGRLGGQGYWRETTMAQLTSTIGLAPLLIVFFQQVSLISPLANWLAVPIIGIVVTPLALLAIILLAFWPWAATQLLYLCDETLQGMVWLLSKMAELPLASVVCLPPPWYALLTAMIGALVLLAPRGVPAKFLSGCLFLPLIFVNIDKPQTASAWLTVLDVGQGLAAVVQTNQHTLIFDTGGKFSEDADMGDSVVIPFLRWQGLQNVDTLVISHGDNDHSGGAASILAEMPVNNILSSTAEWIEKPGGNRCQAGQTWIWDQVKFTILSPPVTAFAKENDNSCVLQIEAGADRFLLTGDIEHNAETWLTEQYAGQLHSTVLIAPHHGSKTSSTPDFLQQVSPELIVIPAGRLNRFGFPHPEVLARYQQIHSQWLNTAEQGAITIRGGSAELRITTERQLRKKYWMREN